MDYSQPLIYLRQKSSPSSLVYPHLAFVYRIYTEQTVGANDRSQCVFMCGQGHWYPQRDKAKMRWHSFARVVWNSNQEKSQFFHLDTEDLEEEFYSLFFLFLVLEIESRALYMLGEYSTTELHLQWRGFMWWKLIPDLSLSHFCFKIRCHLGGEGANVSLQVVSLLWHYGEGDCQFCHFPPGGIRICSLFSVFLVIFDPS